METLKQRILEEGIVLSDEVLLLDTLLTHQVDPQLIADIGKQFARLFGGERVTKVLTVESSGIPAAYATAFELGVPLVFARRKRTLTAENDEVYCERVPSFTKGIVTDILVAKQLLSPNDRVLIIDDIIANGDAARGLVRIVRKSGAELAGFGVVVEKSFQSGAQSLRDMGVRCESLVQIRSLSDKTVQFR